MHLKWSNCPAGDFNQCKGKENFPTVAFEVISSNDREILGISPIQFGPRNDQHTVKLDPMVSKIKKSWYRYIWWKHYDTDDSVLKSRGMYFIRDGVYLH